MTIDVGKRWTLRSIYFAFVAGYKIKELRTQTNTYIKTPVRGEEPVFVITGQPDGVDAAERKIRQDADHFTEIRAVRRRGSQTPTSLQPGHVVVAVAVEQRYVGKTVKYAIYVEWIIIAYTITYTHRFIREITK